MGQRRLRNMRVLAHHDLAGSGCCGEGTVLLERSGRRYLYIAHVDITTSFSVLDVSDPRAPALLHQEFLPHRDVRSNSLAVAGDLLLVAHEVRRPGLQPAGVELFDLADPGCPRSVTFFDTSGPRSRGTHWVGCFDGEHAYLSTGMPDSRPTNQRDDQFPVVVDVRVPSAPAELSRWWLPGTQERDDEQPPVHYDLAGEGLDNGYRSHNIAVYPQRPDRAYVAYLDGGVVILDISDLSTPIVAGRLCYSPPLPGFTHTALPLLHRDLLVIADETIVDAAADYPKLLWVADMSYEPRPVLVGNAPMPPRGEFAHRGGRFGVHNLHENDPFGWSWTSEDIVFATFFSGGVRAFDIRNPFQPVEIAHYVPDPTAASRIGAAQTNDVYVTSDGIVYAVDRSGGGLDVLELTGI
jgi:hypothetical protein